MAENPILITQENNATKQLEIVKDITENLTSTQENAVTKKPLLVYPFITEDLIDAAARGLLLGEDLLNCSSSHLLQLQQDKAHLGFIL